MHGYCWRGVAIGRGWRETTILDKIKWNSKPPSPQIKDEAAQRAKTRHFLIPDYFVQDVACENIRFSSRRRARRNGCFRRLRRKEPLKGMKYTPLSCQQTIIHWLYTWCYASWLMMWSYAKIPKLSPGACIFQRPFLRGLYLEEHILGGAYIPREICVSKSARPMLVGKCASQNPLD